MEFDATQALDLTDLVEESEGNRSKTTRAYLRLLSQKGMDEQRYPLMDGDNVVGRGESCHVHIKAKVLSKEHACIEIINENHFIYDKDSRNKTRRGKLFLKPQARYELNDHDKIVFGDIICIYERVRKDSFGSDTDETQAMFENEPPQDNTVSTTPELQEKNKKNVVLVEVPTPVTVTDIVSDVESDASSDLIGALPGLAPTTPVGVSNVLADDTPTSERNGGSKVNLDESGACIPESQFVGGKERGDLDESIDDLLRKRPSLDDDDDDETGDETDKDSKMCSGSFDPGAFDTQAVPGLMHPSDGLATQAPDVSHTQAVSAATQILGPGSPSSLDTSKSAEMIADTPPRSGNDSTQLLGTSIAVPKRTPYRENKANTMNDSTQILSLSPTTPARTPYKTDDPALVAETPPKQEGVCFSQTTPDTQDSHVHFKPVSSSKHTPSRTATASTPPSMSSCHLMPSIMSISPVEASISQPKVPRFEESAFMDSQSPIFKKPGIRPLDRVDGKNKDEGEPTQKFEAETQKYDEAATQQYGGEATQAYAGTVTQAYGGEATQSYPGTAEADVAATQAYGGTDTQAYPDIATQAYGGAATQAYTEAETQAYGAEKDASAYGDCTQKYGGQATQKCEEATQKYGGQATQKYEEATQKYGGQATQKYEEATQKYGDKGTQRYEEATQKYGGQATQRYEEPTQAYDQATQRYGGQATQKYGDHDTEALGACTQRYSGNATQKYPDEDEDLDATQVYPDDGIKARETVPSDSDATDDEAADPQEEPTPMYSEASKTTLACPGSPKDLEELEDSTEDSMTDARSCNESMGPLEIPESQVPSSQLSERPNSPIIPVLKSESPDLADDSSKESFDLLKPDAPRPAAPFECDYSESPRRTEPKEIKQGEKVDVEDDDDTDIEENRKVSDDVQAEMDKETQMDTDDMDYAKSRIPDTEILPENLGKPVEGEETRELEKVADTEIVPEQVRKKEEEDSDATQELGDEKLTNKEAEPLSKNLRSEVQPEEEKPKDKFVESRNSRMDTSLDDNGPPSLEPEVDNVESGNVSDIQPPDLTLVVEKTEVELEPVIGKPPAKKKGKAPAKKGGRKGRTKAKLSETETSIAEEPEIPEADEMVTCERTTQVSETEKSAEEAEAVEVEKENDKKTTKRTKAAAKVPEEVTEELVPDATETGKPSRRRGRGVVKKEEPKVEEATPSRRSGRRRTTTTVAAQEPEEDDDEEEEEPVKKPTLTRGRKSTSKKIKNTEEKVDLPTPVRGSRKKKVEEVEEEEEEEEEEEKPARKSRKKTKEPEPEVEDQGRPKRSRAKPEPRDSSSESRSTSRRRGKAEQMPPPVQNLKSEAKDNKRTPRKRGAAPEAPTPETSKAKKSRMSTVAPENVSDEPPPKVLFTGVVDEKGSKTIESLGGEIVTSPQACTHLVTDKVRRTVKFLHCLARGIPIVSYHWLEKCRQTKKFVDHEPYIISDVENETNYNFRLRDSLKTAKKKPLLDGYRIHVTKSVQPVRPDMAEIIKAAGGTNVLSMPKVDAENLIIVSCEEDQRSCTLAIQAGITIVSSEFVLTGLLQQKIDVENFRLFGDLAEEMAEKQAQAESKPKARKKRRR